MGYRLLDSDGGELWAYSLTEGGHPTLCCETLRLTGDARDELICWDDHRMFIRLVSLPG